MSLANNNDIIIPNTIGTITAAAREANDITSGIREDMKIVATTKDESITKYIRNIAIVYPILQSRINGIPLKELVNPARISNEKTRTEEQVENGSIQQEVARAYESWFRE